MSLDDPNVIAGITTDGTPFFDDPNQAHNQAGDVDTPIPLKGGAGQLQTASSLEGSLLKFPILAAEEGPTADAAYLRKTSSREMPAGMDMATGMSNADDLRSYEAAVMARKAPTTLNLRVRRPMRGRGRGGGGGAGGTGGGGGGKLRDEGSASASSGNSPHAMGGSGDTTDCSSSSSLANAFGTSGRLGGSSHSRDQTVLGGGGGAGLRPKSSSSAVTTTTTLPFAGRVKKEESASPSLSSRASSAEGDDNQSELGGSSLEGVAAAGAAGATSRNNLNGVGRPSFKRLPSQTLGPDNSKRPFYGFGEEVEDRIGSIGWGAVGGGNNNDGGVDGDDEMVVVSRDITGGSAERKMRRRTMSEPWAGGGGSGGFDRGEDKRLLSRVDVSAVQNVDELWFSMV